MIHSFSHWSLILQHWKTLVNMLNNHAPVYLSIGPTKLAFLETFNRFHMHLWNLLCCCRPNWTHYCTNKPKFIRFWLELDINGLANTSYTAREHSWAQCRKKNNFRIANGLLICIPLQTNRDKVDYFLSKVICMLDLQHMKRGGGDAGVELSSKGNCKILEGVINYRNLQWTF